MKARGEVKVRGEGKVKVRGRMRIESWVNKAICYCG